VKKQAGKKTNHNRSAFLAYGLLTLVVVAIAIGGISAKYFTELGQQNGVIRSRRFFFTSDLLTESNPKISVAGPSVSFELRNFDSGNEGQWAESDITYTVTVTDDTPNDTTDDPEIDLSSGTITNGAKNSVTITLSELQTGKTYVVKAEGKAGYVKTLYATFVVQDQKVYKSLEQVDDRLYLTIRTENVMGNAVFTIPEGLIPNTTETKVVMDDVENYEDDQYIAWDFTDPVSFAGSANASQKYSFIMDDPVNETYSIDSFNKDGKITVNGIEAIEEEP